MIKTDSEESITVSPHEMFGNDSIMGPSRTTSNNIQSVVLQRGVPAFDLSSSLNLANSVEEEESGE